MTKKPKVIIFIDWFIPAFKAGGPVKSVFNIIEAFYEKIDFHIVTSDRDLNDKKPFENIKFNKWVEKNNYNIIYLSPENQKTKITEILTNDTFDLIYLNSLFSKTFSLLPLQIAKKKKFQNKVILAPRGMLGKGALSIKPLKKKIFLSTSKAIKLYSNIKWHATNIKELQDIQNVFGKNINHTIASNLCSSELLVKSITKNSNELSLCFFSRISPKKNLDYAINILNDINLNINFDIYGTIEEKDYWKEIESNIKKTGKVKINYKGHIQPSDVKNILSNYHFLFFPSKHENFGHAIFEALTSGCGLIISDQTPWINLKEKGIGWDISLKDKNLFKEAIKEAHSMSQKTYNQCRQNCISFANKYLESSDDINNTAKLFNLND